MHRSTSLLTGFLGAVVLLGIEAGLEPPAVLAGDPCYHGFDLPTLTVAAGTDIDALPCAFEPTVTTIPVGGTVTFHNGPEAAHLVTGANQAWGERDVELGPNATVSYTFDEAGIYPYACALHRGMSGAIVVGDGGTALATSLDGGGAGEADAGGVAATTNDPASGGWTVAAAGAIAVAIGAAAGVLLARSRRRSGATPSGESLRA